MHDKPGSLCLLDESTLEEFLNFYNISKSKIKKYFTKKERLRFYKKKSLIQLSNEILNPFLINSDYQGSSIIELARNRSFLSISKPANCHIHPLEYSDTNNLLSFLKKEKEFEFLNVNTLAWDRGLLFRLDYETSGVAIFTNNIKILNETREKEYTFINKEYLVIVKGDFPTHQIITNKLSTSGSVVRVDPKGKESTIECFLLKKKGLFNLVRVVLKEGRRHQIRVQLSNFGFPIVGDSLYGGEHAERLFLHAYLYQVKFQSTNFEVKDLNISSFFNFLDLDCSLEMLGNQLFISKC